MKKVVTHAGTFHADEISAIALLLILGQTCEQVIERTFTPTESDFSDPNTFVLDLGKRFEVENLNFDHHQNSSLPATNILILDWAVQNGLIAEDLANELRKRLFIRISDIDRGLEKATENEFNGLIRNFNNMPNGFTAALWVAVSLINASIETCKRYLDGKARFEVLEKQGKVAIQHDTDQIVGWHDFAQESDILLLCCPNSRGGYQLISRDSNEFVIPKNETQTFLHNSGFMAVYPTFEAALAHAKEIAK